MAFSATIPTAVFGNVMRSLKPAELLQHARGSIWLRVALLLAVFTAVRKASAILSQAKLNNFLGDTYDWPRELAVVTGGSGGLGHQLVRKLAKHRMTVISLDLKPPKEPLPSNVHFYQVDITSAENVKEAANQIRLAHGHPTILVNNAGTTKITTILSESIEEIRQVFDLNIVSQFYLIKEFLPAMVEKNHGHVVTIASMRSFAAGSRGVDYSCTKAGLVALHNGLSLEVRHRYNAPKIRTSIVYPGFIRTPLVDNLVTESGDAPPFLEPEDAAHSIYQHIISGNSGRLFLPKKYSIFSGIQGFPEWLQEILRDSQPKYKFANRPETAVQTPQPQGSSSIAG